MPEHPAQLEPQRLKELAAELNSTEAALEFLGRYLSMLPSRLTRILTGLLQNDTKTSMDALLSLKVTSAMNGAMETMRICITLQSLVKAGRFDQAMIEAPVLSSSVCRLHEAAPELLQQARATLDAERFAENRSAASIAA